MAQGTVFHFSGKPGPRGASATIVTFELTIVFYFGRALSWSLHLHSNRCTVALNLATLACTTNLMAHIALNTDPVWLSQN